MSELIARAPLPAREDVVRVTGVEPHAELTVGIGQDGPLGRQETAAVASDVVLLVVAEEREMRGAPHVPGERGGDQGAGRRDAVGLRIAIAPQPREASEECPVAAEVSRDVTGRLLVGKAAVLQLRLVVQVLLRSAAGDVDEASGRGLAIEHGRGTPGYVGRV